MVDSDEPEGVEVFRSQRSRVVKTNVLWLFRRRRRIWGSVVAPTGTTRLGRWVEEGVYGGQVTTTSLSEVFCNKEPKPRTGIVPP